MYSAPLNIHDSFPGAESEAILALCRRKRPNVSRKKGFFVKAHVVYV